MLSLNLLKISDIMWGWLCPFCCISKGLLSAPNTREMGESSNKSLLAHEGHNGRDRMELSPSNFGILQACAFVCLYPLIIWKTAKDSNQHGSVGTFASSARPESSAHFHKTQERDAISKPLSYQWPRGLTSFISSQCPTVTLCLAADSALGCMSVEHMEEQVQKPVSKLLWLPTKLLRDLQFHHRNV